MFGSDVLEVGIGLILLFLLASLICSAVVEMIEGVLKARAMNMERGLRELLQDPDGELAAKLFQHPLIYNLYRGAYDPGKLTAGFSGQRAGNEALSPTGRRRLVVLQVRQTINLTQAMASRT